MTDNNTAKSAEDAMRQAEREYNENIAKTIEAYKLRELAEDKLRTLSNACLDELARRYTIETAKTRIEDTVKAYEQATAGDEVRKITDISQDDTIGPKGRFIDADGVEWVNESLAWLSPHTSGPSKYPWGWKRATPLPAETAKAWVAGEKMVKGELRSFNGKVWRCLQDHTAQTYFKPGEASSLWVEA